MSGLKFHLQDTESGKRIPLEPFLQAQLLTTEENTHSNQILVACPLNSYMQAPYQGIVSCHDLSSSPFLAKIVFLYGLKGFLLPATGLSVAVAAASPTHNLVSLSSWTRRTG